MAAGNRYDMKLVQEAIRIQYPPGMSVTGIPNGGSSRGKTLLPRGNRSGSSKWSAWPSSSSWSSWQADYKDYPEYMTRSQRLRRSLRRVKLMPRTTPTTRRMSSTSMMKKMFSKPPSIMQDKRRSHLTMML